MKNPINILLGVLVLIGCIAYGYGVLLAGWKSIPANGDYSFPEFLSSTVTSIAAVLSTNLGAVLGIGVKDPKSTFRSASTWSLSNMWKEDTPSKIQVIACYVYIASLVYSAVIWAIRGFCDDSDQIVPLIPELTKSLLGVIVGVLAITLNVKQEKPDSNGST